MGCVNSSEKRGREERSEGQKSGGSQTKGGYGSDVSQDGSRGHRDSDHFVSRKRISEVQQIQDIRSNSAPQDLLVVDGTGSFISAPANGMSGLGRSPLGPQAVNSRMTEAEIRENYWPAWLMQYAPETGKGWWPRKISTYKRLEKIGQGTYSSVYKAMDLTDGKLVALKKVKADILDDDSIMFLAREINILRGLDHPNILKLYDVALSGESASLFLVLEYLPHDLAGLVTLNGEKFAEPQVKFFMKQLLSALKHCHDRGIMHRDIKASNLLLDSRGNLKLGDFGLAIQPNPMHLVPLTNRVITLWYRPPEVLMGSTDYDSSVDIWSCGCIFAELLVGKPILPGRTEVEQLHQIYKLCGSEGMKKLSGKRMFAAMLPASNMYPRKVHERFQHFPKDALREIDRMLSINPAERGTAQDVLLSLYFKNYPAPAVGRLPAVPCSHEYNVKRLQHRMSITGMTMQQGIDELRTAAALAAREHPPPLPVEPPPVVHVPGSPATTKIADSGLRTPPNELEDDKQSREFSKELLHNVRKSIEERRVNDEKQLVRRSIENDSRRRLKMEHQSSFFSSPAHSSQERRSPRVSLERRSPRVSQDRPSPRPSLEVTAAPVPAAPAIALAPRPTLTHTLSIPKREEEVESPAIVPPRLPNRLLGRDKMRRSSMFNMSTTDGHAALAAKAAFQHQHGEAARRKLENMGTYADDKLFEKKPWIRTVHLHEMPNEEATPPHTSQDADHTGSEHHEEVPPDGAAKLVTAASKLRRQQLKPRISESIVNQRARTSSFANEQIY